MKNEENLPIDLRAVLINETRYWRDDIAEEAGEIWQEYIYDANTATYCCEMTPSYCLYRVNWPTASNYYDCDDDRNEALDLVLMEGAQFYGEATCYMHCRDIDEIRQNQHKKIGVFKRDPDLTYDEQILELLEDEQGSPTLSLPSES